MSWICMQSFSFIPLMISEEKIFEYVFENLPFILSWQPIKFGDLDKIHMNRRELLKKHFCKKNLNLCSETANIANFHFSHYKSMETISCHSNQSSYLIGTKKKQYYSFPLPIDALREIWQELASWLQRRCRLKVLTTDDDGRTTDACLYYKLAYEPSAQVS